MGEKAIYKNLLVEDYSTPEGFRLLSLVLVLVYLTFTFQRPCKLQYA